MEAIEHIYRTEATQVRATLIRLLGSFELAEEAVQMAFLAATTQWPTDGVPANPRSWLVSAGRFRTIDMLRRRARFRELEPEITRMIEDNEEGPPDPDLVKDDILRLIFTCCHPALPPDQQTALCLREVCGLTTEAIAAAFLTRAPTMAQRIVRAKGRIKALSLPYEAPAKPEMDARLETVLRVVYLVFSEGYAAAGGKDILRTELCEEAIRLARLLSEHLSNPDIDGLLGLMLLQHSRCAARLNTDGSPTPLADQDRSLWDAAAIGEGRRLVRNALARPPHSTYTLQAAIAAIHADALRTGVIDWAAIVSYYDLLATADPGPVVELNRAIAIGMRDGPEAGLARIDVLLSAGELTDYRYARLAKADFLRQLSRRDEARAEYVSALALTEAGAERIFIERRLSEIERQPGQ
ncbi:RNA polymerase sigma factor [Rhizobium sp. LjRoot254]|uniref:RNA polymerase sigma factor n=1 Tax=Rhizobium sp. LjRoot254 TaxID=3342297 RepID=UPI003ECEE739